MNLTEIYNKIKQIVIEKGYQQDIDWLQNILPIEQMSKWYFFREYAWVVINSGFRYQVAKKVFDTFWNNGKEFNFEAIKHEGKHNAIKQVYNRLDFYFNHFKTSKNKLKYLQSLPWIGPITKYHLIRNLGFLEYAKPDRHLTRIASFFNYPDVQKFCEAISKETEDQPGIVDLYFWRFAEHHENYLEIINNLIIEV